LEIGCFLSILGGGADFCRSPSELRYGIGRFYRLGTGMLIFVAPPSSATGIVPIYQSGAGMLIVSTSPPRLLRSHPSEGGELVLRYGVGVNLSIWGEDADFRSPSELRYGNGSLPLKYIF